MSSPGPLFETVVFAMSNMALSMKMPPFELLVTVQRSIVTCEPASAWMPRPMPRFT